MSKTLNEKKEIEPPEPVVSVKQDFDRNRIGNRIDFEFFIHYFFRSLNNHTGGTKLRIFTKLLCLGILTNLNMLSDSAE